MVISVSCHTVCITDKTKRSTSVMEEVRGVMGFTKRSKGSSQSQSTLAGFDPHNLMDRKGKQKGGKRKTTGSKYGLPKAKRQTGGVFKNVNVIRYMGPDAPREFGRRENIILCSFFHRIDTDASGDDLRADIVNLLKQSNLSRCSFSTLTEFDLEFVKCSGKLCRIPQTATTFEWSGDAVKSLCGQGDLYVRLKRDFHLPPVSSPECSSSDGEEVEKSVKIPSNTTPATTRRNYEALQQSSSGASSQLPQVPSSTLSPSSPGPSSFVDLTATSPQSNMSSGDDLPEVKIEKSPVPVTISSLYTIFTPSVTEECVDAVVRLSNFDPVVAMNVLLQGSATGLLQLLRRRVQPESCENHHR